MAIQRVQLPFLKEECDVEFSYSPAVPGRMYLRNGDPGYPPEEEEFEITSIMVPCGAKKSMEILGLLSDEAIEEAEALVKEAWDASYVDPFYHDDDWDQAA